MEKTALPPPPNKRLVKTALHQAVLDERLHQVRTAEKKKILDPKTAEYIEFRVVLALILI